MRGAGKEEPESLSPWASGSSSSQPCLSPRGLGSSGALRREDQHGWSHLYPPLREDARRPGQAVAPPKGTWITGNGILQEAFSSFLLSLFSVQQTFTLGLLEPESGLPCPPRPGPLPHSPLGLQCSVPVPLHPISTQPASPPPHALEPPADRDRESPSLAPQHWPALARSRGIPADMNKECSHCPLCPLSLFCRSQM